MAEELHGLVGEDERQITRIENSNGPDFVSSSQHHIGASSAMNGIENMSTGWAL